MDYVKHYSLLIERAKGRTLEGYSERHHITPKCLGGSNLKENIVKLTPEEHYVAHQLLVKIYPNHKGLIWSLMQMTGGNKRQPRRNKVYGWTRRLFVEMLSKANKTRIVSPEAREKMRLAKLGVKRGKYERHVLENKNKGVSKSEEHIRALSTAKQGVKRGSYTYKDKEARSANIKAALAVGDKTRYYKEEYRAKQAESMKEIWAARKSILAQK